jgi:hypothetical protein
MLEGEIAEEVTRIRTDMQEFVNKQLSGWIQQGVAAGLSNLPPPPSALTLEQIREVIRAEQPNPVVERLRRQEQERANQKEKETFKQWVADQMKEAEKKMEETLAEKARQWHDQSAGGEDSSEETKTGYQGGLHKSHLTCESFPLLQKRQHLLHHCLQNRDAEHEDRHQHHHHHHHRLPPIKEDTTAAGPKVPNEEKGRNTFSM